jgi:hypothetical protein
MPSDRRSSHTPIDGYTREDVAEIEEIVASALANCTRANLDFPPGRQAQTILRYLWAAGFLVRRAKGSLRVPPGTKPTTLGDMVAVEHYIMTACGHCRRSGRDIEPEDLIPRFGPDFAVLALTPFFRCLHCQRRGTVEIWAGIKAHRTVSPRYTLSGGRRRN